MKKLNKNNIISLTKIKEPFLMVDEIKNITNLKSATGIKKISKNSWFFKCHFINEPVMPGTLIEETMLQTIVALLYSNKKFENKIFFIASAKTNFFTKIQETTILKIYIKILKITNLKVETYGIVKNHKNNKIATGNYNYFISSK
jgi:3-hydroxymyristoyl/3-hydroxydecanoyl-(acyl carrier protein) dehydratase